MKHNDYSEAFTAGFVVFSAEERVVGSRPKSSIDQHLAPNPGDVEVPTSLVGDSMGSRSLFFA